MARTKQTARKSTGARRPRPSSNFQDEPPKNKENDWNQLIPLVMNDESMTDITFVIGKEKRSYKCHKFIFGAKSKVFKAMLYGNMKEASEKSIFIEDITPYAFQYVRNHFYNYNYNQNEQKSQSINNDNNNKDIDLSKPITINTVSDIYYAATKYLLDDIKQECKDFVTKVANSTKCDDLYELICELTGGSNIYSELFDSQVIISGIDPNFILDDRFNTLPCELIKLFIKSDNLEVKEEIIWIACVNWCKNKANRHNSKSKENNDMIITWQAIMNEQFLNYIRFPLMSGKFLKDKIRSSCALTESQLIDIYECRELDVDCQFPKKKRVRHIGYELVA